MHQTIPQKLRPETVCAMFGVSRSTLTRLERTRADFPRPSRPTSRITLHDRQALEAFFSAAQPAEAKAA